MVPMKKKIEKKAGPCTAFIGNRPGRQKKKKEPNLKGLHTTTTAAWPAFGSLPTPPNYQMIDKAFGFLFGVLNRGGALASSVGVMKLPHVDYHTKISTKFIHVQFL